MYSQRLFYSKIALLLVIFTTFAAGFNIVHAEKTLEYSFNWDEGTYISDSTEYSQVTYEGEFPEPLEITVTFDYNGYAEIITYIEYQSPLPSSYESWENSFPMEVYSETYYISAESDYGYGYLDNQQGSGILQVSNGEQVTFTLNILDDGRSPIVESWDPYHMRYTNHWPACRGTFTIIVPDQSNLGSSSGYEEVTPDFTYEPVNPKKGDTITFYETSTVIGTGIDIRHWYIDDMLHIDAGYDSVWTWTPTTDGEYTIGLELSDGINNWYTEKTITVAPDSTSETTITWTPQAPTKGAEVKVTADIQLTGTTIQEIYWYINGEEISTYYGKTEWSTWFLEEGTYDVQVIAIGVNGAVAATMETITVGAAPTLTGQVVDHKDKPLPEVRVLLLEGGSPLSDTYTDKEGNFVLEYAGSIPSTLPIQIMVELRDQQDEFRVIDSTQDKIDPATITSKPFEIKTSEDLNQIYKIINYNDETGAEREDHRIDLTTIYIHTWEAANYYKEELGLFLNGPVYVITHVTEKEDTAYFSEYGP